eukprot:tig00021501_g21950.t1
MPARLSSITVLARACLLACFLVVLPRVGAVESLVESVWPATYGPRPAEPPEQGDPRYSLYEASQPADPDDLCQTYSSCRDCVSHYYESALDLRIVLHAAAAARLTNERRARSRALSNKTWQVCRWCDSIDASLPRCRSDKVLCNVAGKKWAPQQREQCLDYAGDRCHDSSDCYTCQNIIEEGVRVCAWCPAPAQAYCARKSNAADTCPVEFFWGGDQCSNITGQCEIAQSCASCLAVTGCYWCPALAATGRAACAADAACDPGACPTGWYDASLSPSCPDADRVQPVEEPKWL